MDIDRLYNKLIGLTFSNKYSGGSYDLPVIEKGGRDIFKSALYEELSQEFNSYSARIASLEAKVYAYEAIIANSNFKPMLNSSNTEYREIEKKEEGGYYDG